MYKDGRQELLKGREVISMRDVSVQEDGINSDKQDVGAKGGGQGAEDGAGMV